MKVVIVEDSEDLCRGWEELLSLEGHSVQTYLNGNSLIEDWPVLKQADVLITDYYLPDINGVELISRARRFSPELPAILLTGAKDGAIRESLERVSHSRLLNKPLSIDALEKSLCELKCGTN